jgi:hypothetical protein
MPFLFRFRVCVAHLLLSGIALSSLAQDSTYQLRVMHYNLLNFGVNVGECSFDPARYQELRTILEHHRPHLFTVNEIGLSTIYPTNILSQCFTYTDDMTRTTSTNQAGGDRTNHLFYDRSLFGLKSESVIPSSNLRDINRYELYFKPSIALGDTVFLTCLVAHLKAGDGNGNANQRDQATQDVMAWVQANGQGKNLLFMGDFNLSSSGEAAFQNLVAPSNSALAWQDPANSLNGWNGQAFAALHTQSTRASGDACFSGGGLDDRFDLILTSSQVIDGSADVSYVPGSYTALGNAGNSYNGELICGPSNPTIPTPVCLALRNMSDHLPVVMELKIQGELMTSLARIASAIEWGPNPVRDQINLQLSEGASADWSMQVYDSQGRICHRGNWLRGETQYRIQAAKWPVGLYLLELRQGSALRWQRKLIKVVN